MLKVNLCRLVEILLIVNQVHGFYSNYTFDVKKYYSMPKLSDFDEYDECMDLHKSEAKYCYVKSLIKPDYDSLVYRNIEEYSSRRKQHFRHDRLTRGICLNRCMEFINSLDKETAEDYYQPLFDEAGATLTFDFINYRNYAEDRRAYNKIINQCVNSKLKSSHNLTAYSSIEYCTTFSSSSLYPVDSVDIAFIFLSTFILLAVFFSSSYDAHLRESLEKSSGINIEPTDYYRQTPDTIAKKFMLAFSMKRNWYILSSVVRTESRDTRAISGIRFWCLIGIIYGHISWYLLEVPLRNPLWIEKNYHLMRSMIVINGGNHVQNFFIMSGFLNSLNLLTILKNKQLKSLSIFWRIVAYRYFRFVPVVIFLMMLNATWMHKIADGPFWDKVTIYERHACRQSFWTNLLFINNYVSNGEMRCMIHTWYLAADFHLSALGTVLLLLAVKYPKKLKLIFYASVAASFIISFIQFYVYKLEPILIIPPESLRNQILGRDEYDGYFASFHAPTHFNAGNYLIGLIMGYFYFEYKQHKAISSHSRSIAYHILWLVCVYLMYVLAFVGVYFYEYDMPLGILSSLLGAFFKHIYGPLFGVMLIGMFFGYGWLLPKMLNYGMFRVVGRLTFSVYLVHPFIATGMIMKNRHPVEVDNFSLFMYTYGIVAISFIAGLFLTLWIEIPVQALYKTISNDIIGLPQPKKRKMEKLDTNIKQLVFEDKVTKC